MAPGLLSEAAMSAFCLLLLLLPGGTPSDAVRVAPRDNGTSIEVTATLPAKLADKLPAGKLSQEDGQNWLRLHLVNNGKEGPAIFGSYQRKGNQLLFVPTYPLQPDYLYRVRFAPPDAPPVTVDYKVPPRPPRPPAEIVKLLPTDDVLPANHLRFYIYFSQPMRGGSEIFEQIRLLDADGKEVSDPWLHDELWNDDSTMLILYIHPGRIKWGVLLRLLMGPVLEPDRQYTLVISGDLMDGDGRKLGKEFRKKFSTTAEDRKRIELTSWKVKAPKAGTTNPVTIDFPKAIDHLGLERFLTVTDAKGNKVAGKVEVTRGERSWRFHPAQAWTAQEYAISVDERLEDVAGNTPAQPFDVDADAPVLAPQRLTLTFRPN
jgi:hypothetical protein